MAQGSCEALVGEGRCSVPGENVTGSPGVEVADFVIVYLYRHLLFVFLRLSFVKFELLVVLFVMWM